MTGAVSNPGKTAETQAKIHNKTSRARIQETNGASKAAASGLSRATVMVSPIRREANLSKVVNTVTSRVSSAAREASATGSLQASARVMKMKKTGIR